MDAVTTPVESNPPLPAATTVSPPEEPRGLWAGPWDITAIASAICGLILIVPYLAGVAAIALAIMGLRQVAQRGTRGRRLAYAGIVLGLLNIVGWTVYFRVVAELSAPGRFLATHFITDLSTARTGDAKQLCQANIGPDRLESAASQLTGWGGAKRVTVLYITTDSSNGATTGTIRGDVQTPSGRHAFQLTTANDLITDFTFQ